MLAHPLTHSRKKLQSASVLSNFANTTDCTDGALVLSLVLTAIESTSLECTAGVDGCIGSCADVKFCKLIEFNVVGVVGVAFALGFYLLGLWVSCQ